MSALQKYSRQSWIQACQFPIIPDGEVLTAVLSKVRSASQNSNPIVVLDLDSTLIEVAPRTLYILNQALEHLSLPPHIEKWIGALTTAKMGFSLKDSMEMNGLDLTQEEIQTAHDLLKSFWWERFFHSDFLVHDTPYPEATNYVEELIAAGAHVVYLTARDEPGMGSGTHLTLRKYFPFDIPQTTLIMKPTVEMADHDHKIAAAQEIHRMGPVVASFENEPRNYVELFDIFPDSIHVFVDTVCSEQPAEARLGGRLVKGFQK